MKVSELIEELKKYDKDMVVKLEDWNEEYAEPHELEEVWKEADYLVLGVDYLVLGVSED